MSPVKNADPRRADELCAQTCLRGVSSKFPMSPPDAREGSLGRGRLRPAQFLKLPLASPQPQEKLPVESGVLLQKEGGRDPLGGTDCSGHFSGSHGRSLRRPLYTSGHETEPHPK